MPECILRKEQVLERIGFGKTWLHDQLSSGKFPKPVYEGRTPVWRSSDIDRFIDDFFTQRADQGDQPTTA